MEKKNVYWAPNQYIRIISEGSCDAEGRINNAENSALTSHEYFLFIVILLYF